MRVLLLRNKFSVFIFRALFYIFINPVLSWIEGDSIKEIGKCHIHYIKSKLFI